MGPIAIVLISGVSAFQGVKIYSSNGDTFRSFRAKCPLNRGVRISEVRISGVPLYTVQLSIAGSPGSAASSIARTLASSHTCRGGGGSGEVMLLPKCYKGNTSCLEVSVYKGLPIIPP